jgi:hypothetical protein
MHVLVLKFYLKITIFQRGKKFSNAKNAAILKILSMLLNFKEMNISFQFKKLMWYNFNLKLYHSHRVNNKVINF